MRKILSRLAVIVVVGALTSGVALAKVRTHRVKFDNDIRVNNTLVKKGNYDVRFDDESGQFSILKNKKVVVTTTARLEPRAKEADDFQFRFTGTGNDSQLTAVTFGGWNKDVVLTNGAPSNSGSN
ncbi:MAG: hypothetical protein ABR555_13530 [Pyrinomonadaceae bacterium]